eukprot:TRINITY_DN27791_c0_g1_i1.p1 TRINITY_DN27791_c0_g1~~TRINITY_DN27791_c0_g1_i1.p1  ORF type:complete len:821 (-),score=200.16 TRINITY_DN27791_c0_g1_i1:14-2287(-)
MLSMDSRVPQEAAMLPLLEALAAVAEERGNPLLPLLPETAEEHIFSSGAPIVEELLGQAVSTFCLSRCSAELLHAMLRCTGCWLPWVPASVAWVSAATQCLVLEGWVGDEAADALVEAAFLGAELQHKHAHLPEAVCAAVVPLLPPPQADPASLARAQSRVLRVAAEAAEALLPTLGRALLEGDALAKSLIHALAVFASGGEGLRSIAHFFHGLAAELQEREGLNAATDAFEEALRSGVSYLSRSTVDDDDNQDALELCAAAARALGPEASLGCLLRLPASSGRTWAFSILLPRSPARQELSSVQCELRAEIERAISRPTKAGAALLAQAGQWLAADPELLSRALDALVREGYDHTVHSVALAARERATPCLRVLLAALDDAAGKKQQRHALCSAAVAIAREQESSEAFRAVISQLAASLALGPSAREGADACFRGLVEILAGLRGLERSRHLSAAAEEAFGHAAQAAWSYILQEQVAETALEPVLDVLSMAFRAISSSALPPGQSFEPLVAKLVGHGSSVTSRSGVLRVLASVIREFGREEEICRQLERAVTVVFHVACELQELPSLTADPQSLVESDVLLEASWQLLSCCARRAPCILKSAGVCFTGKVHAGACKALASAAERPQLAVTSLEVLEVWLEEDPGALSERQAELQQAWNATAAALRSAPPAAVLKVLPAFLMTLRERPWGGPPESPTLEVLLEQALSGIASGGTHTSGSSYNVSSAAEAVLQGGEPQIEQAVEWLAHVSRRLAVRGR